MKKIIRSKQLCEILSVSRTTLWRMENEGQLPARIQISKRSVGWLDSDIEDWLERKANANTNQEITSSN